MSSKKYTRRNTRRNTGFRRFHKIQCNQSTIKNKPGSLSHQLTYIKHMDEDAKMAKELVKINRNNNSSKRCSFAHVKDKMSKAKAYADKGKYKNAAATLSLATILALSLVTENTSGTSRNAIVTDKYLNTQLEWSQSLFPQTIKLNRRSRRQINRANRANSSTKTKRINKK